MADDVSSTKLKAEASYPSTSTPLLLGFWDEPIARPEVQRAMLNLIMSREIPGTEFHPVIYAKENR